MEGLEGITVTGKFHVHYTHNLPNYPSGVHATKHSHSVMVEVGVNNKAVNEESYPGMVVDPTVLHECVTPLLEVLKGTNLNDSLPLEYQPPTLEHVTAWLVSALLETEIGVGLVRVRLTEETYSYQAEWRRPVGGGKGI